MRAQGRKLRTIWVADDGISVDVIDQTILPARLEIARLRSLTDAAKAIRTMRVRGAPLIGVTAAYGLCLALGEDATDEGIERATRELVATRPTAVNLRWALDRMHEALAGVPIAERRGRAYEVAARMADDDVATCEAIGAHGAKALEARWNELGRPEPFHVLTHCNAGWLATVDWGTALAPIYVLHARGFPLHVWVSETRPRNQGLLTEWELREEGVPRTLIADNAAGHLLASGRVHACIVGSDRTTRNGDVCNKIGTYLKALAAREASVPFYAAVPGSTIDFAMKTGAEIPIEERAAIEVIDHPAIPVFNPGFDVTPAKWVSGIITERGVAPATHEGLAALYPERV